MHYAPRKRSSETIDRRTFLRMAGYGSMGLLALRVGGSPARAAGIDPSTVSRMEFDVIYRTQIYNLPRDAGDVHVWMPLPPEDRAQQVHDLTISCPMAHEIRQDNEYGNRLVHVQTDNSTPTFTIESRYHIVRSRVSTIRQPLDAESAAKYLRLTPLGGVTDEVAELTDRVVGQSVRPAEIGRKVYDAVIDLLTYDKKIAGCGLGNTEWIMKHQRGKCDDYHSLFMAMMVSRGVPVRWEQGFPLPYPSEEVAASGRLSGDCSGAHCWVSFHDPDLGWIPVDVSEADKRPELRNFFFGTLTPNRFQISEGRSIMLSPRQGVDALNTFAFAYAEADGIPLIYQSNYENEIQFTVTNVERG